MTDFLDYSDVFIFPKYSEVRSRKDVSTSISLGKLSLEIPVISANMDSITGNEFATEMWKSGGIGALHRFCSVEQNIEMFKKVDGQCFVSVGVVESERERTEELFKAGARNFIIDIAHGHSVQMKEMMEWIKGKWNEEIFLVSGNVATREGTKDLISWGADAIKCGIAVGMVCITRNVTGVTVPQFSAVRNCVMAAGNIPVIADGGIKEIGDIAKALGAGATAVMCGSLFSDCSEALGRGLYRGMASREAMVARPAYKANETLPTPEGTSIEVNVTTSVKEKMLEIKGGLQSSLAYLGTHSLEEFRKEFVYGVRKHRV